MLLRFVCKQSDENHSVHGCPIFGGHFSTLFSLFFFSVWRLYLEINHTLVAEIICTIYIHSFMHVHNTTFQIKTVFNNVLFSTEVHNPLHVHLLALSHIYIYILYVCMYVCVYIYLYIYIYAYYHYCFNYYYHYYFLFRVFSYLVANYQEPIIVHNSATTTTHSDINTNLNTKTHNACSIWQLTCQKSWAHP